MFICVHGRFKNGHNRLLKFFFQRIIPRMMQNVKSKGAPSMLLVWVTHYELCELMRIGTAKDAGVRVKWF